MVALEILYRDEHLLVIDKPSGLLTHRGWGNDRDTVLARARTLAGKHVYLPHRLDRATSGVLVVALDPDSHRALALSFAQGRVHKSYLAIVRGHAPQRGTIDHPIRVEERAEPLSARSDYERLGSSPIERCSAVRLVPHTGRPHQIRRHLKHISHPIVGDTRYGDGRVNRHFRERYALHRLALHASELRFEHPASGEPLCVRAPLAAELSHAWRALGLCDQNLEQGELPAASKSK